MKQPTTAAALQVALQAALTRDERIVLLGESVGRAGGLAGTTQGLLDRFGPERVLDLPVADRAAAGLAVGLALAGRRPVLELSATGRLVALLEVLAEAAAVARAGEFAVPLVVRVPYGSEAGARVDRDVAYLLAAIDGLTVVCPADPGRAVGLLEAALQARGPVVILEPRQLYGRPFSPSTDEVALNGAHVVREGRDLTLVAWGMGVGFAAAAADRLDSDGISADVVDVSCLFPVDTATLGARVRHTGRIVAVYGSDEGLAQHLLHAALRDAFWSLESVPTTAPQQAEAIVAAARASLTP